MSDAVPSATSSLSQAQRWCDGTAGVVGVVGAGDGVGSGVAVEPPPVAVAPLPPVPSLLALPAPLSVTLGAPIGDVEEPEQPPAKRPAASARHEKVACNCLDMATPCQQPECHSQVCAI